MTTTQKLRHLQGVMLLVTATLIWSTSFACVKEVVASLSPAVLLAVRFAIAALIFLPLVRRLNARLLLDGSLLGLVLFSCYAMPAIGLETAAANRAGFIASLSVIFVPSIELLLGRRVPKVIFLAAGLALLGIGLMSWEGGGLRSGDLWMFGFALSYAAYILRLEAVASRHSSLSLTAVQLLVVALLGTIWAAPELSAQLGTLSAHFGIVLYLSAIATATTTLIQAVGQRWVPASEAALLYTLEPVFGACFSFWLLGERFGMRGLLGAVLVVAATVLRQSRFWK